MRTGPADYYGFCFLFFYLIVEIFGINGGGIDYRVGIVLPSVILQISITTTDFVRPPTNGRYFAVPFQAGYYFIIFRRIG